MVTVNPDTASELSERTVNNEQRMRIPRVNAICRRIHGWSWQAFPVGMGTGAVYVVLFGLKDRSPSVATIETVFYFLNMALFLLNTITLVFQAIRASRFLVKFRLSVTCEVCLVFPRQAYRLLTDPVKGIFVPLIVIYLFLIACQASCHRQVLSFATILIGTINYAVPSHHVGPSFIYVLFWVYVTFALLTCFPMLMIWFNKPHDIAHFTPAYAFLIFPMMLVGVVAFNVLRVLSPEDNRALGVLLVGYFFQGLGFFMTFFYICIYIIRIMMTGFLEGHQANGAFVACGPPGFTALALIKLGRLSQQILAHHNLVSPSAGEIWYASSVMGGLLLFGLAVFFFIFGALPWWFKVHKNMKEILGCWALTFPNVGWIATLRELGDIFQLRGFYVLHLIMAIAMGAIFKSPPEVVVEDSTLLKPELEEEKGGNPSFSPPSPV
ncbi:Malic acid transport protein [Leucoagaricus sp. SymC.cos]|nr:Malic acid transport protein [Leucoagaricus sp. SymC.cos]